MKVKIIRGYNGWFHYTVDDTLEKKINNFIKENNIEIKDIKLSTIGSSDVSIALIMYEELKDRNELAEYPEIEIGPIGGN